MALNRQEDAAESLSVRIADYMHKAPADVLAQIGELCFGADDPDVVELSAANTIDPAVFAAATLSKPALLDAAKHGAALGTSDED